MDECLYVKQKRDRKQRKAGIIFCRKFNEDKGILSDCKTCKKKVSKVKYLH
jgi:hypothetical protein